MAFVAIPTAPLLFLINAWPQPSPSFMDTPAWMQVVEPRLEQAAEVVPIPLLWRGARQGGVVERCLPAAGRYGTGRRGIQWSKQAMPAERE